MHYRAPQEVIAAKTTYYFPVAKPLPHKDVDYPWVGMTYALGEKTFGVVEIDHPANPRGTRWSAYRTTRDSGLTRAPISKRAKPFR
ncbi:hypothetical protein EMGBS10_09250 [Opitutia bacterium]|nr:hypothetical protein EMGBS10_09250 [Opitutae bacterium]